jgi:hypothetical protein
MFLPRKFPVFVPLRASILGQDLIVPSARVKRDGSPGPKPRGCPRAGAARRKIAGAADVRAPLDFGHRPLEQFMRIVTATAVAAGLAVGVAALPPVANATMVEGKIMWLGAQEPSVTINKKTYRVSESTKVLVSGKPGSYASLKPGMTCKANVANGAQTTSLICTGRGRDPLPTDTVPVAEQVKRPAGQAAGGPGGGGQGGGGQGGGQAASQAR